ncbi:hypothetical protein D3C87_1895880 [compost metagenome]
MGVLQRLRRERVARSGVKPRTAYCTMRQKNSAIGAMASGGRGAVMAKARNLIQAFKES